MRLVIFLGPAADGFSSSSPGVLTSSLSRGMDRVHDDDRSTNDRVCQLVLPFDHSISLLSRIKKHERTQRQRETDSFVLDPELQSQLALLGSILNRLNVPNLRYVPFPRTVQAPIEPSSEPLIVTCRTLPRQ